MLQIKLLIIYFNVFMSSCRILNIVAPEQLAKNESWVYEYDTFGFTGHGVICFNTLSVADQNFLNFMQFLGKSGKFVCWRSPSQGLAPPPTGNPVSAPAFPIDIVQLFGKYLHTTNSNKVIIDSISTFHVWKKQWQSI